MGKEGEALNHVKQWARLKCGHSILFFKNHIPQVGEHTWCSTHRKMVVCVPTPSSEKYIKATGETVKGNPRYELKCPEEECDYSMKSTSWYSLERFLDYHLKNKHNRLFGVIYDSAA